ncbi:hypothetical protein TREMEDRAFT_65508 [Tremella mesenterica DSM 1558]|uniref:uncharacterized protein n=1 Tax=Tremella mesenterica (strain ATCC 24925 / CBS 8224 / DSM 1558 / NBRC 9311 / NRRL Y-6157 / RJB 2259-6 / UBC 559-6) TaxID=578456 RepID=UPI00032D5819|nr:uncharacterized protein TREMEDRAFT_65508 [Tremella mesenterica DSM 1558]EIW66640.1 hypothetical protein TREMEDRAFT_65508 [Tremella mesenterica DSM 1558]
MLVSWYCDSIVLRLKGKPVKLINIWSIFPTSLCLMMWMTSSLAKKTVQPKRRYFDMVQGPPAAWRLFHLYPKELARNTTPGPSKLISSLKTPQDVSSKTTMLPWAQKRKTGPIELTPPRVMTPRPGRGSRSGQQLEMDMI